jgi:SAM-dependent methyltransferase
MNRRTDFQSLMRGDFAMRCPLRFLSAAVALLFLLAPAVRAADEPEKPKQIRTADCVYVPTPNDVTAKMLEMAGVKQSDLLYDLGCGDGRIVVTAAKKFGCKAVGYEIDPQRVAEALENVKKRKVEKLAKIEQKDIFTLDLSEASVIALYLLPAMNVKLLPQLEKLKAGARIVAHDYPVGGLVPEKTVSMKSNEDNVTHTIYFYTVPLKKEKK